MFKTVMGAVAALSMATVPAMASAAANPASSLSVSSNARTGATTSNKNQVAGGGAIFALAIVAGIVAIGVIAATKDDNVSTPTSP
ncbi:MAG: hypothetical protein OSB00_04235 [Sphingomonas bacterium]|nr:hypothetical protein [Sphingomonas bacterium]